MYCPSCRSKVPDGTKFCEKCGMPIKEAFNDNSGMTDYEQALVFAAKNGNEKSFEELYKIYYNKVYSLAKATLKNDADAEDVLQQTFIQAWRNISTLEDTSAFNTWIQRITLNQCYSLMRKSKPEISIDEENDEHGVLELESDLMLPEVYAQQEDLRIRLGKIIDGLSEVQRQTVQLFYFDNMSVEEIAKVMDCSVGTVKSRLFLARKAIRTEIEETERKTGTKLYGIAGIPMLAFGKLFSSQVEATSIQASTAISTYSKITAELFGTAKSIVIETAKEFAKEAEKATAKAAEKEIAKKVTEKQTETVVKNSIKKATSSVVKNIGSRIVAAVVSGGILCGSLFGSFADVSAAKVTTPDNSESIKSIPAYCSYIDLLNEKKENIEKYTWQKGHYGSDEYWITDEPQPVVIADVYGDDTPELIYMSVDDLDYCSVLHIVTYQNGSTTELYNEIFDSQVGGESNYYLYQRESDKTLYAYSSFGCDYWTDTYTRFAEEDGKLVEKVDLKYDSHPDYDNVIDGQLQYFDTYYLDDIEITEEQYKRKQSEMTDGTKTILMRSKTLPDNAEAFVIDNGCAAMTCKEALLYLKNQIGNSYTLEASDVPDSLKWFLLQFNFGYSNHTFDSQKPVDDNAYQNIIYRIMTNGSCSMNYIYPGKLAEEHWDDGTTDPKGKFSSYLVSNIEKAKWIAKNIFNITDENISKAIKSGENNGLFYTQNEKAYLELDGVGGPACDIDFESVTYDGSRYHLVYTHYIEDFYADSAQTFNAELEYKEINGCHYWSLYKRTEYIPETANSEGTTIDASHYLGTWENENDQLFIRSVSGNTVVFSYAFYRRYGSDEISATLSGNVATFSGAEDGTLTFYDDSITLHLNKIPVEISKSTDSKDFTYKKTDWKSIYSWFVQGYEFMRWGSEDYGTETDYLFGLYDLDNDGTPELLIHNGYNGRALRCAYCYTVANDSIAYAGICPTEAYYVDNENYPGLIGRYSDSSEAYWYYYSKSGTTVSSEPVYTEITTVNDSSIQQNTTNNQLFNACSGNKNSFNRLYTMEQISEMGWDKFVSEFDKHDNTSSTNNEVQKITIDFAGNRKVDLEWGWNLFNKDASEYDHNIAMAGLILSQAAESGESVIKTRYKELGFENTSTVFYSGRTDNMDMPASCFASSKIELNGMTKYVVSVTVRGTGDGGDILTDLGSVIYGFNTAANNVKDSFKSYYDSLSEFYHDNVTPNNTILFITGHSLGGAIAGQLGQMLEGICGHRNSIFDYTFASPNYQTFEYDTESFTNIHNIINKQDLVPTVPWGYGKYGHCWYYDACDDGLTQYLEKTYSEDEWNDIKKGLNDKTLIFVGAINSAKTNIVTQHLCQTYMACMLKGLPSNMGDGAKTTYSLSSIHCPVDIQILDKDGNLAAWTSGEKVYYTKGANLIIVIDKDEKYVYVPDGIEYNIIFIGTDTGTMNYTQQIISNDEVVSEKNFENVSIETGKLLYASVNAGNASGQKLKIIDESGHIERNVKESGKETAPFLSLSIIGWVFLCLDVVSGVLLFVSIISFIKKKKEKNNIVAEN